jgi:hypothetical protein
MQIGSISPNAQVQQSVEGAKGSAGIAMMKHAFVAQEAMVEKLLSPPAPGTGTIVDKQA